MKPISIAQDLKRTPLTESKREQVFRKYGHRCHYPFCDIPVTKENPLCIHDITDSGNHDHVELMRPLCRMHHNQATQDARSAKIKIKRFKARGIKIGTNQGYLIEQEFYGSN